MVPATRPSLEITSHAYIAAAILLMVVPVKWMFAWIVAAAFHECCHCLALMVCRKPILGVLVEAHGMKIRTTALNQWEQLFCTIAGPGGALLLVLVGSICPRVAVCAFLQSVYNLLPLLPLDGGKVLQCLLGMLLSDTTVRVIMKWIKRVLLFGIILLCLVATVFLDMGILPTVLAVSLLLMSEQIKIPCKSMSHRVQ